MVTLSNFYRSDAWRKFREVIINERTRPDGFIYDEETGEPIVHPYDIILHHKEFLTDENVNDAAVTLNPDLIEVVSHRTHNRIHNKLGRVRREVFLVYGPPLAGKSTYVQQVADIGDLIVDIDLVWSCITGGLRYEKPVCLNPVAFGMRDYLMESVFFRRGRWNNAYIVGGYPLISERERICKRYGAREIYVEANMEQCLERLEQDEDRDKKEWKRYIESWFDRYSPPPVAGK